MVTKKTISKKVSTKATPKARKVKADAGTSTKTLSAAVYDAGGKKVRELALPENLFAAPKNDALLYQVVTAMQANARTLVAHTKNRGEVRGGGRKPWRQKGTGRARHGSRRSPIWKGGGITFGPRNEKIYAQKINKKMRARALAIALSQKFSEGKVLFVDSFALTAPKTKEALASLASLSKVSGFDELRTRRNNATLIALGAANDHAKKSFRNMGNVLVEETRNLNPVDVLSYRFLVVTDPEASLASLSARMNGKSTSVAEEK